MTDYERGYHQGYADAMNWKTQNHLEHLPGRQEPVAWVCEGSSSDEKHAVDYQQEDVDAIPIGTMLYSTPPQRPWVGLTPEEVKEISFANRPYVVDMVVALEARLKEKNT